MVGRTSGPPVLIFSARSAGRREPGGETGRQIKTDSNRGSAKMLMPTRPARMPIDWTRIRLMLLPWRSLFPGHVLMVVCLMMAIAVPALGASRKDHDDCNADNDPARNIAGCTRVLGDLSEKAKTRSIAYVGRGLAYLDKGDRDSAIADFTDAIRLDPKNAHAYNDRGLAWKDKGDHDRALADLTAAIAINPLPRSDLPGSGFVNVYANRGSAWQAKGDLDRAIADFDRAVSLAPRDADAFNRRGNAWQAKGEADRAIADFTLAIAADPRFAGAYFNRGVVRQAKALPDLALTDFGEALRLDPGLDIAYYARAQIYMTRQDTEHAIAELDEMIRRKPDSPAFVYYLRGVARYDSYMRASVFIDPEDLKRAIADFSEAIRQSPYYKEAYRARAMAEETDGQHELAAADLAKAEGRDPIRFNPRDGLQ